MPIFTVFLEHQPNLPSKAALKKTITLHNAQNKTWCFRNGLLWKLKTFMLAKTHNWKNKKTKIRKGIWTTKQNRKPSKTEIIYEKKPFKCNIWCCFFCDTKAKKQGNKEQQKNKEGKNKQESKEEKKKTRNKKERERERERERETESEKGAVKEAKEKERETLRNEQHNPFSVEIQCFCKEKTKYAKY